MLLLNEKKSQLKLPHLQRLLILKNEKTWTQMRILCTIINLYIILWEFTEQKTEFTRDLDEFGELYFIGDNDILW